MDDWLPACLPRWDVVLISLISEVPKRTWTQHTHQKWKWGNHTQPASKSKRQGEIACKKTDIESGGGGGGISKTSISLFLGKKASCFFSSTYIAFSLWCWMADADAAWKAINAHRKRSVERREEGLLASVSVEMHTSDRWVVPLKWWWRRWKKKTIDRAEKSGRLEVGSTGKGKKSGKQKLSQANKHTTEKRKASSSSSS